MIAITQLKEEVESLKKQLQQKDTQLLEKDKKVNSKELANICFWYLYKNSPAGFLNTTK